MINTYTIIALVLGLVIGFTAGRWGQYNALTMNMLAMIFIAATVGGAVGALTVHYLGIS